MKQREITTTELFNAISVFSEQCVTKEYLDDALKGFATKEDLKAFATKEDLNGVKKDLSGVKEDLNGVKEDLSGVKKDLSGVKEDLAAVKKDLNLVKEDLGAVKEDLSAVKEDTQKILQLLPSLVHKEDRKVNTLVERLVAKRVFARAEVADILDTHPLVP